MPTLDIKTYGAAVLRRKAEPVTEFGLEFETLVRDMFKTMYAANGVGLAAPQVGLLKRLIVIDIEEMDAAYPPLALVNPELSQLEGEVCADEGCLSFPGLQGPVKRAEKLHVDAQTPRGDRISFDVAGWMARVLQHEVDHLNGVLFIDQMEKEDRKLLAGDLRCIKAGKRVQGDVG